MPAAKSHAAWNRGMPAALVQAGAAELRPLLAVARSITLLD
jgi:hypothetical protein